MNIRTNSLQIDQKFIIFFFFFLNFQVLAWEKMENVFADFTRLFFFSRNLFKSLDKAFQSKREREKIAGEEIKEKASP